jgi:PAS domain S-box-containing protein
VAAPDAVTEPDVAEFARALFEECGDALFLFDPDTETVLDVNPMAQRLCGFSRRELLRRPIHYLFRAEAQGGLGLLRQAYRKTGLFHSQEGFYLRREAEGSWLPVNLSVTRLHTPPRTLGLITVRDISERRAAQLAVQKSEAELQRVLDSVSAYLWSFEFDAQGRPVSRYYSPGVERVTGRPAAFFIPGAERWLSTLHAEDRPRLQAKAQAVLTGVLDQDEDEFRMIRLDGSVVWVHASVRSQPLPGGGRRVNGVMIDVTQRRQAEEAAQTSEERFRAVVEQIADGVALLTADGTIAYASRAADAVLGYAANELAGQDFRGLIHPDDRPHCAKLFSKVLTRPGCPVTAEFRCRHKDGSWRRVEGTARNRLDDPAVRAVVATFRDITERRALEAQLVQAQKMDAVGQLAGGLAHDFNNLLTAVLGNLSLLLSGLPAGDPNREFATGAERAAQRAAGLTSQLLGISRRSVLRPQPLSLNATVEEVLAMLRRTIDPRISLEPRRAEDLGLVEADPGQMTQVLLNLCLNARDAMPEGGRLVIETANVVVAEAPPRPHLGARAGAFVRLRVSDTGTGIAPELLDRIFEPFFTTKAPGQGTGLGLAMVFGIVQQHRGWVECASEVGRGSCFDVYLARAVALEARTAPPSAEEPPPGRETVLLVDDEPMIRQLGGTILRRYGYQVLEAEDGQEAVDVFRQNADRIDLVVLDLTMPRLSGHETYRVLRELKPAVRVLFASGYSAEYLTEADREHAHGFVNKPYRAEELARLVREALDRV